MPPPGFGPKDKDKARIDRAIDGIFERFPILKEKRSSLAGSMSGGQQRFLEIARALVRMRIKGVCGL